MRKPRPEPTEAEKRARRLDNVRRNAAARRAAEARLVALHPEQYARIYEEEKRKQGILSAQARERKNRRNAKQRERRARNAAGIPRPIPESALPPLLEEEAPLAEVIELMPPPLLPHEAPDYVPAQPVRDDLVQDDPDPMARRA